MELEECIKDAADAAMQEYITAEFYRAEQDRIDSRLCRFRELLDERSRKEVNGILDEVNISDSRYAYQSFKEGIEPCIGRILVSCKVAGRRI